MPNPASRGWLFGALSNNDSVLETEARGASFVVVTHSPRSRIVGEMSDA